MAEAKEKQEELDLQLEDQDVEVTIDDQPEDVQIDAVAQDDQTEDEFKKAESQTQKRINRLTKKMRDAEKNADEALRFAKQKEQENKELAQKLNQMDTNYVDQYSGRVDSQMAQAEQKLRAAMELGDTEAAVSAQKEMTTLAVEADRAAQAKAANERRKSAPPALQPVQQPVQQAPQEPDAKAQAWAQKNEWFGNDSAMTYAAFGIHKDLVEQEGIDPKSDEYYTELNERMVKEFPHKFNNGAQSRKVVQNVASASRSTTGRSSGKKQVRLTNRQVAIAKKLGVPLEEYAKYVKE